MNKSKMKKVSVIVAVYNVELFIRRCLDSLSKQTFNDFEVLLIDDGSTDNSRAICEEYAKKDSRFILIHKSNGGVASARQLGLDKADGEYIIHVDPDDWVEKNMLEELYNVAKEKKADVVICDYYRDSPQKTSYVKQMPDFQHKSFFQNLVYPLHGSCCNKFVRHTCFSTYDISFSKDLIMWEDKLINLMLAEKPIVVAYLPNAFYHYMVNANGAVANFSKKKIDSIVKVIDWLETKKNLSINDEIIEVKKLAKTCAFRTAEFDTEMFKKFYPEVDKCFSFCLSEFGRSENFYTTLAIKTSIEFSRFVYACKTKISMAIRTLWDK